MQLFYHFTFFNQNLLPTHRNSSLHRNSCYFLLLSETAFYSSMAFLVLTFSQNLIQYHSLHLWRWCVQTALIKSSIEFNIVTFLLLVSSSQSTTAALKLLLVGADTILFSHCTEYCFQWNQKLFGQTVNNCCSKGNFWTSQTRQKSYNSLIEKRWIDCSCCLFEYCHIRGCAELNETAFGKH